MLIKIYRNNPKLIFKETSSGLHSKHAKANRVHKLYLKHVCSPYRSPQGSEVNAEHSGTLLEAHSGWILLVSMLFIYLNSVKTSHLPSFLFNLQEIKKNTSGFLCCVDPLMCRAVTPSCILLLIVQVEMHPELCRTLTAHSLTQNTNPRPLLCNYHPGPQASMHVRFLHTSHHYFTTCEKWAWEPKQLLQQTTQWPQHKVFNTTLLLDFPFWYNQNKTSQWLLFRKFRISLLLPDTESRFLITFPHTHSK